MNDFYATILTLAPYNIKYTVFTQGQLICFNHHFRVTISCGRKPLDLGFIWKSFRSSLLPYVTCKTFGLRECETRTEPNNSNNLDANRLWSLNYLYKIVAIHTTSGLANVIKTRDKSVKTKPHMHSYRTQGLFQQ